MGKPKAYFVATHQGRVRARNEDAAGAPLTDSVVMATKGLLFVVADGVGGASAGDDASKMVVEFIQRAFVSDVNLDPGELLSNAVKNANMAVFTEGQRRGKTMATTVTAAIVHRDKLWLAHVGDSRAYLASDGGLHQLTKDHTPVQEALDRGEITADQASRLQRTSEITRAIGSDAYVDVDVTGPVALPKGASLMLCSDGLYSEVPDNAMAAVLRRYPPEEAGARLIQMANADKPGPQSQPTTGGRDNITVAVADVDLCRGVVDQAIKDAKRVGWKEKAGEAPRPNAVPTSVRPPIDQTIGERSRGPIGAPSDGSEGVPLPVGAGVPLVEQDHGTKDTIGREGGTRVMGPRPATPVPPVGPVPMNVLELPPIVEQTGRRAKASTQDKVRRWSSLAGALAAVVVVGGALGTAFAVNQFIGPGSDNGPLAKNVAVTEISEATEDVVAHDGAGTAVVEEPAASTTRTVLTRSLGFTEPETTDTPVATPTSAPTPNVVVQARAPLPIPSVGDPITLNPMSGIQSGCLVTLGWNPSQEGDQVLVCAGQGCPPESSIYRGTAPYQWEPAKPVGGVDYSQVQGTLRWMVLAASGTKSGIGSFEWRGGRCSDPAEPTRGSSNRPTPSPVPPGGGG